MEMDYIPPQLLDLMQCLVDVESKYKKNNPVRDNLIKTLKAIHRLLSELYQSSAGLERDELKEIAVGAWLVCLISIEKEYKFLKPERSELYRLLMEALKISSENQISHKLKLYYINKFHHYFFKQDDLKIQLEKSLNEENIPLINLEKLTLGSMQIVLKSSSQEVQSLIKAPPTEIKLSSKMSTLYQEYEKKIEVHRQHHYFFCTHKENRERILLAQLAQAISELSPSAFPIQEDNKKSMIPRSQRVKLGILFFIMQSIYKEYYVRSPKRSNLYELCSKALNIDNLNDVDSDLKVVCISTLKNYLNDYHARSALEEYGIRKFIKRNLLKNIDTNMDIMNAEMDQIILKLLADNSLSNWPATKTLGETFSLLCAAPGYGIGYVAGYSVSETNYMIEPKIQLGRGINYVGTAFLGFTRGYLGFLVAGFFIQSTLTRAFAKVLEQLGKLIGYATGAAIGFSFDISYKGLRQLCECYFYMHSQLYDPSIMKDIDHDFVKCLMDLPEEVFTQEKKERLTGLDIDDFVISDCQADKSPLRLTM